MQRERKEVERWRGVLKDVEGVKEKEKEAFRHVAEHEERLKESLQAVRDRKNQQPCNCNMGLKKSLWAETLSFRNTTTRLVKHFIWKSKYCSISNS